MNAQRATLSGARQHFAHGPIDLVIGVDGAAAAVAGAHEAAWARFQSVLAELAAELPLLRQPVGAHCALQGGIARRMWQACAPHRSAYITPMAAVAGAVAQEIIACYARPGITRAWVNNGGDIALHLTPGSQVRVGLVADVAQCAGALAIDGRFSIDHASPVRGIATSGWRGRSFSLGIADSVTVLADSAAEADAAATIIANAVDAQDARIERRAACELKDDTDLGSLLVTVDVPALPAETVRHALANGLARARELRVRGLIREAALVCQGHIVTTRERESQGDGMVRELLAHSPLRAAPLLAA
jgi:uncharacterized protein